MGELRDTTPSRATREAPAGSCPLPTTGTMWASGILRADGALATTPLATSSTGPCPVLPAEQHDSVLPPAGDAAGPDEGVRRRHGPGPDRDEQHHDVHVPGAVGELVAGGDAAAGGEDVVGRFDECDDEEESEEEGTP